MAGLFIAFEGIDGSGKYTQLERTRVWLAGFGYAVRWSSEPNGVTSPIGRYIRAILRGVEPHPSDPLELQRMYVIDRAQDVFCAIRPWLSQGGVYLIERYGLATIAYGIASSNEKAETFIRLHEDVLGRSLLWPDCTIVIDVPPEIGLERRLARSGELHFFERQAMLEKVRQNYLTLAKHPYFKSRIEVVDGNRPPEAVFADVQALIQPRLPRRA